MEVKISNKAVWNKMDYIWDTNIACYKKFYYCSNFIQLYLPNLPVWIGPKTGPSSTPESNILNSL